MQRKKKNGPECELSEKSGGMMETGGILSSGGNGTSTQRKVRFSLDQDWNGKGGRKFAEMITERQGISIWWLLFSLCGGMLSHLLKGRRRRGCPG